MYDKIAGSCQIDPIGALRGLFGGSGGHPQDLELIAGLTELPVSSGRRWVDVGWALVSPGCRSFVLGRVWCVLGGSTGRGSYRISLFHVAATAA